MYSTGSRDPPRELQRISDVDAALLHATAQFPTFSSALHFLHSWIQPFSLLLLQFILEKQVFKPSVPGETSSISHESVASDGNSLHLDRLHSFKVSDDVSMETLSFGLHSALTFTQECRTPSNPAPLSHAISSKRRCPGKCGLVDMLSQLMESLVVLSKCVDLDVDLQRTPTSLFPSPSCNDLTTGQENSVRLHGIPLCRSPPLSSKLTLLHTQYCFPKDYSDLYREHNHYGDAAVQATLKALRHSIEHQLLHIGLPSFQIEGVLEVRCRVRDLFIGIPVRRLPFCVDSDKTKKEDLLLGSYQPGIGLSRMVSPSPTLERHRRKEQEVVSHVLYLHAMQRAVPPLFRQCILENVQQHAEISFVETPKKDSSSVSSPSTRTTLSPIGLNTHARTAFLPTGPQFLKIPSSTRYYSVVCNSQRSSVLSSPARSPSPVLSGLRSFQFCFPLASRSSVFHPSRAGPLRERRLPPSLEAANSSFFPPLTIFPLHPFVSEKAPQEPLHVPQAFSTPPPSSPLAGRYVTQLKKRCNTFSDRQTMPQLSPNASYALRQSTIPAVGVNLTSDSSPSFLLSPHTQQLHTSSSTVPSTVMECAAEILFSFFPSFLPKYVLGSSHTSDEPETGGFLTERASGGSYSIASLHAAAGSTFTSVLVKENAQQTDVGDQGMLLVIFWSAPYLRRRVGTHAGTASKYVKLRDYANLGSSVPVSPEAVALRRGGLKRRRTEDKALEQSEAEEEGEQPTTRSTPSAVADNLAGKQYPFTFPYYTPPVPPLLLSLLPSDLFNGATPSPSPAATSSSQPFTHLSSMPLTLPDAHPFYQHAQEKAEVTGAVPFLVCFTPDLLPTAELYRTIFSSSKISGSPPFVKGAASVEGDLVSAECPSTHCSVPTFRNRKWEEVARNRKKSKHQLAATCTVERSVHHQKIEIFSEDNDEEAPESSLLAHHSGETRTQRFQELYEKAVLKYLERAEAVVHPRENPEEKQPSEGKKTEISTSHSDASVSPCAKPSSLVFQYAHYQVQRGLDPHSTFPVPSTPVVSHGKAASLGAALSRHVCAVSASLFRGGPGLAPIRALSSTGARRTPVLLLNGKAKSQKTFDPLVAWRQMSTRRWKKSSKKSAPFPLEPRQKLRDLLDTAESNPYLALPPAFKRAVPWNPSSSQQERRDGVLGCRTFTFLQKPGEREHTSHSMAEGEDLLCSQSFLNVLAHCSLAKLPVLIQWNQKFVLMIDPGKESDVMHPSVSALQWHQSVNFTLSKNEDEFDSKSSDPSNDSLENLKHQSVRHSLVSNQHRWWLIDPHAIHERLRLELFLIFSEAFVVHPEFTPYSPVLPAENVESQRESSHMHNPTHHVPQLLTQLENVRHLMEKLERSRFSVKSEKSIHDFRNCCTSPSSVSFPVLIPEDLTSAVTAFERHLWRWGWRFACHPTTRMLQYVTHWPLLRLEGFAFQLTAINDLRVMVEDLQVSSTYTDRESSLNPRSSYTVLPSSVLSFLVSRSCRGAVMLGDIVTPQIMWEWLECLRSVRQYYCCAHGRPSAARLLKI